MPVSLPGACAQSRSRSSGDGSGSRAGSKPKRSGRARASRYPAARRRSPASRGRATRRLPSSLPTSPRRFRTSSSRRSSALVFRRALPRRPFLPSCLRQCAVTLWGIRSRLGWTNSTRRAPQGLSHVSRLYQVLAGRPAATKGAHMHLARLGGDAVAPPVLPSSRSRPRSGGPPASRRLRDRPDRSDLAGTAPAARLCADRRRAGRPCDQRHERRLAALPLHLPHRRR